MLVGVSGLGDFADTPSAQHLHSLVCRPLPTLIRDVGFDPVDAGPLRIARYTEPFTLLIAQLAYRFERF